MKNCQVRAEIKLFANEFAEPIRHERPGFNLCSISRMDLIRYSADALAREHQRYEVAKPMHDERTPPEVFANELFRWFCGENQPRMVRNNWPLFQSWEDFCACPHYPPSAMNSEEVRSVSVQI